MYLCGDIRKMYHTIEISYLDQHTLRFLWRNLNASHKPAIHVMNVGSFGDKPAGAITMTALRKTAKLSEAEFPEACKTITENTYVDDILDSTSDVQAARKLTRDIDELLSKGSLGIVRDR